MKLKLILTTAIVGAALTLPGISSAWAQAPPNDTFEQATVISSLPFSQTLDTSEATIDSTDFEALAACGLSGVITGAATVWYEYTPSADQRLLITTPGTSYNLTGVAVLTGSPGSLSAVTCFPDIGSFSATAGVTYHILVADIGGGSGGTLHLSVETGEGGLTVDRFGRFDPRTGIATVTGTLACTGSDKSTVSGDLSQRTTFGTTGQNGFADVACNGVAQQWSIAFTPFDGKFKGGPADVSVGAGFVCVPQGCIADQVDRRVILRG
jgi:hypothetical protein